MLDRVFRPVLANDLRREVGRYQCWQLVASCALVRRTEGPIKVSNPNDAIAIIQERIQDALERDVRRTFAVPYFVNIRFRIAEVALPERVQAAVDDAQAEFAAVSGARAEVVQARYQRRRNALLADVYERSPELARIDAIKAAPRGATVIVNSADGRSGSPPVLVGGGAAGAAAPTDAAPAPPGG
jgi:hypothetical protein